LLQQLKQSGDRLGGNDHGYLTYIFRLGSL
jgi:hypothetical protein